MGSSFPPVIEFLGHPVRSSASSGFNLQARHERAEHPGEAAQLMKWLMSARPAPGYWILTATWRPSCQTARCTWPIEAAAAARRRTRRSWTATARPSRPRAPCEWSGQAQAAPIPAGLVKVARYGPAISGDRAASNTDSACPSLVRAPPFELAQDPEDLIRGPPLDFLGRRLAPAAQPLPGSPARSGPRTRARRQPQQSGRADDAVAEDRS